MAKAVEVEVPEASLGGSALEHLPNPVFRQHPLEPEPGALGRRRPFMRPAHPEVAVDRASGLHSHGDPADAPSLPQHGDLSEFQVDVMQFESGDLGTTQAAVEEEPDDCCVAPLFEGSSGAGSIERLEVGFRERVDGRDLDCRGLGAAHG